MTSRPSRDAPEFRQNRDLIFHFSAEGLIATDPRLARPVVVDPRVVQVLMSLDRWTTPAQLAARLGGVTPRQAARALGVLETNGLVQRRTKGDRARTGADTWTSWGPHAAAFHFL